jgi:rare lipoprotein A
MTHTFPMRMHVRSRGGAALALGALLVLSACGETGEFSFGTRNAAAEGPAPIGATPLAERDVEAPEIFEAIDEGLWDGRPSLGGVWVAHPDAVDPERVLIRNEDNGRYVIGALFRRERENPGPVIQVSSNAAEALEILAGAPTNLQIVALRREEAPLAPDVVDGAAAEAALADPADLPPVITASLPAADEPMADGADLAGDIAAAPDAVPSEAPAPRRGFLARLFQPAAAGAATQADLPEAGLSADDVAAGIATGGFQTEALDPIAAVADAAIVRSEATEVAALAPAAVAAPAPTSAPAATALERPFVQIGIFSAQENADNTGQALRNAGLVPTIYDQTSNGRRFWRVVVGPAPTAEDRAAVLETVRGLGFGDAYFVTR